MKVSNLILEIKKYNEKEFIGIISADGFIRPKPKHQRNNNSGPRGI